MKALVWRGLVVALAITLVIVAVRHYSSLPRVSPQASATRPVTTPRESSGSGAVGADPIRATDPDGAPAPEAAAAQSTPHYTIHVLDARTREPASNSQVRWANLEEGDPWFEDEDLAIAAGGNVGATDASGRVEIPVKGDRVLVHAEHDTRFGTSSFVARWARADALEVLLWPDFDVVVSVLDRAGRAAAEVPVALRQVDGSDRTREAVTATDVAGLAVFRHVGQKTAELRSYRLEHDQVNPSWEVGLDLCALAVVSAPVRPDEPPHGPIVLTLPEAGSVVLEGVDARGDPIHLSGEGCLTTPAEATVAANCLHYWRSFRGGFDVPFAAMTGRLDAGRLVFPHVGLGLQVVAFARRNDASRFFQVEGTGPAHEGEQVILRVVVGTEGLVLRGRAVDERRQPMAEARLSAWLDDADDPDADTNYFIMGPEVGYEELGSLTTDRLGRFVIDADALDRGLPRRFSLVLAAGRNRPDAREGIVDLPANLSSGDADVGDLVLVPAPIVASGTVIDESDQPVGGCSIDGPIWKNMTSGVSTRTDGKGRFELRGILLDTSVELNFTAALRPSRFLSVSPGSRDLVVRMPRTGGLKARLVLPPGAVHVTVALHREDDGSDGDGDNVTTGVGQDGEFFDDGRWPGQWTMVASDGDRELLRRSGITIRGGEITDLGAVALVGGATAFQVTVKSAATGELLSGAYLVRPRGTGKLEQLLSVSPFGPNEARRFDRGEIRFVELHDSVDLELVALGHRAEVLVARAGEQEVRLRPALRLPLRIVDFAGLPPPPSELHVVVGLGDESELPIAMAVSVMRHLGWSSPFDRAGRAELLVPTAGRWSVQWFVVTPTENGTRSVGFAGRETTIDVGDEEHPAEILLHPDRDTSKAPEDGR